MHPIVWLEIIVPETARAIHRTSQNSAVDKVVQANRFRVFSSIVTFPRSLKAGDGASCRDPWRGRCGPDRTPDRAYPVWLTLEPARGRPRLVSVWQEREVQFGLGNCRRKEKYSRSPMAASLGSRQCVTLSPCPATERQLPAAPPSGSIFSPWPDSLGRRTLAEGS